jgi:hypothetical protein
MSTRRYRTGCPDRRGSKLVLPRSMSSSPRIQHCRRPARRRERSRCCRRLPLRTPVCRCHQDRSSGIRFRAPCRRKRPSVGCRQAARSGARWRPSSWCTRPAHHGCSRSGTCRRRTRNAEMPSSNRNGYRSRTLRHSRYRWCSGRSRNPRRWRTYGRLRKRRSSRHRSRRPTRRCREGHHCSDQRSLGRAEPRRPERPRLAPPPRRTRRAAQQTTPCPSPHRATSVLH